MGNAPREQVLFVGIKRQRAGPLEFQAGPGGPELARLFRRKPALPDPRETGHPGPVTEIEGPDPDLRAGRSETHGVNHDQVTLVRPAAVGRTGRPAGYGFWQCRSPGQANSGSAGEPLVESRRESDRKQVRLGGFVVALENRDADRLALESWVRTRLLREPGRDLVLEPAVKVAGGEQRGRRREQNAKGRRSADPPGDGSSGLITHRPSPAGPHRRRRSPAPPRRRARGRGALRRVSRSAALRPRSPPRVHRIRHAAAPGRSPV